jgi:hypothetical protein
MNAVLSDLESIQMFLRPYRTDDQGRFRVFDIPPGSYYLRIEPPPEDPFTDRLAPAFYPGSAGPSRAEPVRVTAGSETRLSPMILAKPTLGSIRVHVVDMTGESPSYKIPDRISIRNISTGFAESSGMDTGKTGSIRPNEAGKYHVCASRHVEETGPSRTDQDGSGALFYNRYGCVPVQYDGSDLDVTITLKKPDGHMSARLTLEDADSASNKDFELTIRGLMDNQPEAFMYTLKTDESLRSPNGIPLVVRYAGHGELLAMTSPSHLPEYYVASARQGSRDVLSNGFEIPPYADSPLNIVVSGAGGSLQGKVIDSAGNLVPFSEIVLVPQGLLAARSDRASTYRIIQTDQNGAYEFRGLIPGDYRAYALSSLNGFAFWDEASTKQFVGVSKQIHVEKRSRLSADLNLIRR